ncbi:response regulator [Spirosoma rhododendri]|uniref:Response regulator n=1 Tax=Spirosoma rhododendri TaxID=2728024 RepID=A0A7L5DT76_9BACT|nr:response regulator [Spirosoma rhododendri]QJD81669.1 response regulator [Spirosoma rhododendri]
MKVPAGSQTIVYIDSDHDDHFLIGTLFNEIAPERPVRYFSSAEPALAYLRQSEQQPFIILCEVMLRGMSGLELRETIQADEQLVKRCIPFIFMSNPVTQHLIEKAFGLTVQGFFEKSASRQQQKQELELIFKYWQTSYHPNRT